jgi:hypothetical protein
VKDGFAVCGAAGEVYQITDFLLPLTDNRTQCQVVKLGSGVISNCSGPLFPATPVCGYVPARIEIYFKRADATTTFASNIETYLANLGLQVVTSIGELLLVQNSDSIPKFAPKVFPNITNVDRNLFIGSFGTICNPIAVTNLPFTKLLQVGGKLTVDLSAFTDLSSFSGLTCVGDRIRLSNNPQLTSLDGLGLVSNVAYAASATTPVSVNLINNPLQGRASLNGIAPLARCNASIAKLPIPPSIQVLGCPRAFITWSAVCTYLQTSVCPSI